MIVDNERIIKNAQIELAGNLMKSENFGIRISNIIQVWPGMRPKQKITLPMMLFLLFADFMSVIFMNELAATLIVFTSLLVLYISYYMQEEFQGLNIQLSTGEICTFTSDDKDFINQVYQTIIKVLARDDKEYDYVISFKDHLITDNLSEPEEEIPEVEPEEMESQRPVVKAADYNGNANVIAELEQLYTAFENESEINQDFLALIEQTMLQVEENDQKGVKESFEEFLKSGIINECNQLGLNLLIEEIKKKIFYL